MQLEELNSGVHLGDGEGAYVERTQLPSGVRVLTERMPSMRSATFAVWVPVGSRHEIHDQLGSTHFLEHLVFKGTKRRSAADLALAFDEVGGISNAATSKEFTYYYAHVRDADLPMAAEIVMDMVTSATLRDADIEAERGVILDELAMDEDDAEDVALERLTAAVYGDHPLGRPVGGTPQSVQDLSPDNLRSHREKHYHTGNFVVTAAGNVDHELLCSIVESCIGDAGWSGSKLTSPRGIESDPLVGEVIAHREPQHVSIHRPLEQVQLLTGCPGLPRGTAADPTYAMLHTIFGGDSSSRLNQEIRERAGLTYSVYSFGMRCTDSGIFAVSVGCAPHNLAKVTAMIDEQWRLLAESGVTAAEYKRALGGLAGGMALGLERTGARMRRLAEAELLEGEFFDAEENIERLQAVTLDDIQALAADLYARPRHTVAIGPVPDAAL